MTQSQTLNVEYDELMARADEIERPLPAIRSTNPPAPFALSAANDAVAQLAFSAESIRFYLEGCEGEWKSLAKSLRDAAKAYEEVDEGAADAINNEGSASGGTPALVGATEEDMPRDPSLPRPAPPRDEDPYYEVRQATADIETGDQGTASKAFAREWDKFQLALQRETYRFRSFTSWEGDARILVEQNFDQQREWISEMVHLCSTLSDQALKVPDAQEKLWPATGEAARDAEWFNYHDPEEHPGPIDLRITITGTRGV